jgi:tetratricopeptide (TPR) repeat protein
MKLDISSGFPASIPFFQRAVEIDPTFAFAYANLGLSYRGVEDSVRSAQSATRAWQLRDRVSDRERFFIDFTYDFSRFYLGGLHSAYVRGEAFVAAHRYVEAAAEFQKILDHRGIVGLDPIGTLAHVQLGRAFALSGDVARSKTAYQDFFSLWKDADPDVPFLTQARAEYARLR